jgi:hypothetical protein
VTRGPVRAGRKVGDVALQPGQVPGLSLQFAVDALDRAVEGDEPVPLDRRQARDGLRGLGGLLVDPPQRPPRPVGPELVVDHLITALRRWPGRPGLGEDAPVGDVLARVLPAPLVDDVGDVGTCGIFMPRMNDRPAASIAF